MAVVEIEMLSEKFGQFLQFIASTGPIPLGILNSLGTDRLIADFTWNAGAMQVGLLPPGYTVSSGRLGAQAAVNLRHVSIAELDADPNAVGTSTPAIAWVDIGVSTTRVEIRLVAMQVIGRAIEIFPVSYLAAEQDLPEIDDVNIERAALILHNGIVTLRFTTLPTDPLLETPRNMLDGSGDEWAIRLSSEVFTEVLLRAMEEAVEDLPEGTSLEEAPSASWEFKDGNWAAIGKMEVEKKDACPGVFGEVDISATVNVELVPSVDMNPPAPALPQLILALNMNTDASDWDSFRCWLGNGGLAATILGWIMGPLVSPGIGGLSFLAGGISSLIAVAEIVRLEAGNGLDNVTPPANFHLVDQSDTSANYRLSRDLPSLVRRFPNGGMNGSMSQPDIGPHGIFISGNINFLPAEHNRLFDPNSIALEAKLRNTYKCNRKIWLLEAEIQTINIEDHFTLLGADIGRNQVRVFNSTTTKPAHLWVVSKPDPAVALTVAVKSTDSLKAGDSGRIYLHTSAGIRRYDIAPLSAIKPPTELETIAAVIQCTRIIKFFTPIEKINWLIDPPYRLTHPPLRQWMFTFSYLKKSTTVSIYQTRNGNIKKLVRSFVAASDGEGSFELLTDDVTEIMIEHNQESSLEGKVMQRWLIPVEMIEMGETGSGLVRTGSLLTVPQKQGIFTYNLLNGVFKRRAGILKRSTSGGSEIIQQTKDPLYHKQIYVKTGVLEEEHLLEEHPSGLSPFSISLPDGKVAALFDSRLVIAIPNAVTNYVNPAEKNLPKV